MSGVHKIYSNIKFEKNVLLVNDSTRTTFPEDPTLGTECLVNGMKYIYTEIGTSNPSWMPIGVQRKNKSLIFEDENLTWSVEHGLDTMNLIVVIYDSQNRVITAPYTILSKDLLEVNFSVPTNGRIVVFGASSDSVIVSNNIIDVYGYNVTYSESDTEPGSDYDPAEHIKVGEALALRKPEFD